jgi:hypothetical protein
VINPNLQMCSSSLHYILAQYYFYPADVDRIDAGYSAVSLDCDHVGNDLVQDREKFVDLREGVDITLRGAQI